MEKQTIEIRPENIEAAKRNAINAMALGSEAVLIDPMMLFAMVHALYTRTACLPNCMTMEQAVRMGFIPTITVEVEVHSR